MSYSAVKIMPNQRGASIENTLALANNPTAYRDYKPSPFIHQGKKMFYNNYSQVLDPGILEEQTEIFNDHVDTRNYSSNFQY